MSDLIMVIRHGEKESPDGQVLSVDRAGRVDSTELSVRGWERAAALVEFFGRPQTPGVLRPAHLYAPAPTEIDPSVRPWHTITSLADRLERTVSIKFCKGEEKALCQEIQELDGPVLIAWEHKAIIQIANVLMGSTDRTPQEWPEDRYDVIWAFTRSGKSPWRFEQVPQLLFSGDSSTAIRT